MKEQFKPLAHRLELICTLNETLIYNDSKATNIESMRVAINAFDEKIIFIVGGLDKGQSDFYNTLKKYHN